MLGQGLSLFRMTEVKVPGPSRPDGFRVSVEERTEPEPKMDYPDGSEGDITLDQPEEYGYQEYGDRPVNVSVVSPIPGDSPMVEWTTGTVTLSDDYAQEIGSGDRRRQRFVVRNLSESGEAYITRANMDQSFAAFTLIAGEKEEFLHNGPIWARGAVDGVRITYFSEFVLEEAEHER
jgi:hypothetical protein